MKHGRVLRFWMPVVLCVIVMFIVSSIPGNHIPKISILYGDKIVHCIEFFVFGFLLVWAFLNSNLSIKTGTIIIISVVMASLYAAFEEWHQRFIPYRTSDVFDFVADNIGLIIGIMVYSKKGGRIASNKTV